jgi:hypothetical protein
LQTDPSKRLGSGEEDAEAIKRHPFFANLDWDKVYRKQLSPPLPKMKKLIPYLFSDEVLQEARMTSQNEYMDNWSFIVDGI